MDRFHNVSIIHYGSRVLNWSHKYGEFLLFFFLLCDKGFFQNDVPTLHSLKGSTETVELFYCLFIGFMHLIIIPEHLKQCKLEQVLCLWNTHCWLKSISPPLSPAGQHSCATARHAVQHFVEAAARGGVSTGPAINSITRLLDFCRPLEHGHVSHVPLAA